MSISSKIKAKIEQISNLSPVIRLVWKSSPVWTIARTVLLFAQGILPLVLIYLSKLIVDVVAASFTTKDKTANFEQANFLLVAAGVVTILITLCQSLSELVNSAHSQQVTDYMQSIVHSKSIKVDLEHYENPQYYDTMQRAQNEAPYRPTQILNHLTQVGQNGVSLIAIIGLLLSLHWSILGILMVASIPAVLVRVKYSQIMYVWQRKRTQLERQSMYLDWMLTDEQYAKEIRLFDLGFLFSQKYRKIREKIYREQLGISTKRCLAFFLAQAIAGMIIFAIFASIVYQALQSKLQLGDLVLYYQALQRGQANLTGFLASLSGLYEDNLFIANLYEFLDIEPDIVDPEVAKPIPLPMEKGIAFHDVSFQYANSTRQALDRINLMIKPGETIALVGANGSGKTTLIKLLCRLYDPNSGSITIDGIDIRQFKTKVLRRQISVIFQDYAKYHFSAQENIWLGNIDLLKEDDKIVAAARRSGADKVIASLPEGYNTILGKIFDRGEELSIGQWQKVALARAFLRDSQIIVLDEPTSALDPKAEYEVFQQFRQLIANQAAILITHRLSTVKMADRIYVMNDGLIVEHGTHDELMQLNGSYAQMFETQARNYR